MPPPLNDDGIDGGGGYNALFLRWLNEFTIDATDNQLHALNKAIRSLRSHREPIHDPRQLIHLKFFGPKIVKRLDKQFNIHNGTNVPPTAAGSRSRSAPRNVPPAPVHDGQQPLCFTYCDHHQLAVPSQSSAHIRINQELQTIDFAVLFRASALPAAKAAGIYNIQPAASERFKDEPDTYHGYLPETSGHASRTTSSLLPPLPSRPRTTDPIRNVPVVNSIINRTSPSEQLGHRTTHIPPPSARVSQGLASTSGAIIAPELPLTRDLCQWPPHTYDIVCLVDTREVKNAKAREDIANGLRLLGVPVQRCSLELGDFLWIARKKQAFIDAFDDGQIGNQVVLDFIVERKRLDDLVTSIKDGRFHEQKFRLKLSGLTNVFFVVETSQKDKNEAVKRFEPSINTAITSTQIIDGFFVHQTRDTDATVKLLKVLHDAVCHKYKDETLWIIPHHAIHRDTFAQKRCQIALANPQRTILTLYKSFCLLNAKSTFQVARECFAKQLLCIRGLSPERVSFIVDEYGTIRALWEAFRQARIEEERMIMSEAEERVALVGNSNRTRPKKSEVIKAELLLADLGKGRRRIGKELSSKIYNLFMKDQYDN